MDSQRQFSYGISRPGWVMIALLLVIVALLWAQYIFLDLSGGDAGSLIGMLFVMMVLAVVLVPVPAMEIMWLLRGRVVVDSSGLRWRGWGGWHERAWEEILAVGMPPADARKQDDERIHVVMVSADEYEFIHGFGLRNREGLREALRSYGDLAETEVVGTHTFLCRPGTGETVRERAREHVDPGPDDAIDFWAGRFRRF